MWFFFHEIFSYFHQRHWDKKKSKRCFSRPRIHSHPYSDVCICQMKIDWWIVISFDSSLEQFYSYNTFGLSWHFCRVFFSFDTMNHLRDSQLNGEMDFLVFTLFLNETIILWRKPTKSNAKTKTENQWNASLIFLKLNFVQRFTVNFSFLV